MLCRRIKKAAVVSERECWNNRKGACLQCSGIIYCVLLRLLAGIPDFNTLSVKHSRCLTTGLKSCSSVYSTAVVCARSAALSLSRWPDELELIRRGSKSMASPQTSMSQMQAQINACRSSTALFGVIARKLTKVRQWRLQSGSKDGSLLQPPDVATQSVNAMISTESTTSSSPDLDVSLLHTRMATPLSAARLGPDPFTYLRTAAARLD